MASMGPHLFRYGKRNPAGGKDQHEDCFNGATSFQIWKARKKVYEAIDLVASMGPHLFRYGKLDHLR